MLTDIPEWVLIVVMCVIAYYYQRSRWGIRIMTKETMDELLTQRINDKLWDRWTGGKLSLTEYIRLGNILSEILNLPDLCSRKKKKFKLKNEITKRIKQLRNTPKPNLPKEDVKPITTKPKLTSIKLNGNQAA